MRRVLFVSFRFPPHADGGVHRVAAFTKYLPRFGWQPHVLTGPLDGRRNLLDPSLLKKVPSTVRVTRSGHISTKGLNRWLRRMRLLGPVRMMTPSFPMMDAGWIPSAYRHGLELLEKHSFDAIFSSAYPMSSHVVAGLLARKSGLPWVADYRDEWSTRSILEWPTTLHQTLAHKIDRNLIALADRVITTSPVHTERFNRVFGDGDSERFLTITNGFDEEDFSEEQPDSDSLGFAKDKFTLAHVGSLDGRRNAEGLIAAVRRLIETGVVPQNRIEVIFAGRTPGLHNSRLEADGVIRRLGVVAHPQAIETIRMADVLVLINDETDNVLGKSFEYFAANRPILGLLPNGATKDILQITEAGMAFRADDVSGITTWLSSCFRAWEAGDLHGTGDPWVVAHYSRRATTQLLASTLTDTVLARQAGDYSTPRASHS